VGLVRIPFTGVEFFEGRDMLNDGVGSFRSS